MNLGIEDAWVFAELAGAGRLSEYDALRRPVDRAVVRQVELLTRIASGESAVERFAREWLLPIAVEIPPLRKRMLRTVSGLDHPLPDLAAEGAGASGAREAGNGALAVSRSRASAVGASAVGAAATGSGAAGSLAIGALAIGALAPGIVGDRAACRSATSSSRCAHPIARD